MDQFALGRVGDKAAFEKDSRFVDAAKHVETGAFDSAVDGPKLMNNVGVNRGSESDVFCVAHITAQRRAPGAATVGGSSALRGESIGFNALSCARTRCVVMNADKDGVPGAVGDVDPLTQGEERVITSGHDRFESSRFQRLLKANGCVEGIVLFVSADAFGPGIVGAMTGVNDNGVKTDWLLDVAGTNHRID